MAYTLNDNKIGTPDLSSVVTAGNEGAPFSTSNLPNVTVETVLGAIRRGYDANNGESMFIWLAVPKSTVITAGLLYQWNKNYNVVVVPVGGTSKNTGVGVAAALNAVASNANSLQYTWFQIQGAAVVLKTAVTVNPQSAVYISATAGRVKVVSSAGQQILGASTQNTATVTSTTSSVVVYLNFSAIEGA